MWDDPIVNVLQRQFKSKTSHHLRKTPGDVLLLSDLSCIVMVKRLKARVGGFERARSR